MSSTKVCTGMGLVCSGNPSQVTLENRLNSATLAVQIRAMQNLWDALFKLRFVFAGLFVFQFNWYVNLTHPLLFMRWWCVTKPCYFLFAFSGSFIKK